MMSSSGAAGGVASGAATCLIGLPRKFDHPLSTQNCATLESQQGFVDLELVVAQQNPATIIKMLS